MFTRSNTKARTKIAKISVGEKHTNATLSPRSILQSLQSSTSPHLQKNTSKVQTTSTKRMESSDGIRLRLETQLEANDGQFN